VINIKEGSWRLREHQALTQPLAQLNDPPERPSLTSPVGARPQARLSVSADRSAFGPDPI
jgi:hypothetical protein